MSFRCIFIENPAKVSIKGKRVVITTDNEHQFPIEDITALLIENCQTVVTAASLSTLGQCGCTVFICDEKHLPCAVLLPFNQHSRALHILSAQLGIGEVKKKHLWQQIVKAKITNQAECLLLCGRQAEADIIAAFVSKVSSGDAKNMEAIAAQKYFPLLFYKGFYRGDDSAINSALNYGYAILRGYTARCLAVYGFSTQLGLHHCNELNSYNLADDLMEPFRPVIDMLVYMLLAEGGDFNSAIKKQLVNCLNLDILVDGKVYTVAYAIELLVKSLSGAILNDKEQLAVPKLLPLNQHEYE